MQARVVVFPVRGRSWCFARPRATAPAKGGDGSLPPPPPPPPPTLKDLWHGISRGGRTVPENAESVVNFVADKMNTAWIGFGSSPEGSMKNRIHSFGLKLLSRVRPSETLLKSVTKDVSTLEIVHPASVADIVAWDHIQQQRHAFFGKMQILKKSLLIYPTRLASLAFPSMIRQGAGLVPPSNEADSICHTSEELHRSSLVQLDLIDG